MAKKTESIYKSWQEVDDAMKVLGEKSVALTKLEGEQTVQINEIKSKTLKKAGDLKNDITLIQKNIERFADAHKSEFLQKRTKKLNYGTISYRIVKKVVCSDVDDAIKCLRALNMDFCIRTKMELDKDVLIEQDEKLLQKANISIKTEDKIKIEPNFEKLMAQQTTEDK